MVLGARRDVDARVAERRSTDHAARFETPSFLRWRIAGIVSRFIGAGVGFARLVAVSSWKVVDIVAHPLKRADASTCLSKTRKVARCVAHI